MQIQKLINAPGFTGAENPADYDVCKSLQNLWINYQPMGYGGTARARSQWID